MCEFVCVRVSMCVWVCDGSYVCLCEHYNIISNEKMKLRFSTRKLQNVSVQSGPSTETFCNFLVLIRSFIFSLLIILLSLAKLRARELVIHLVVRDLL